MPWIQAEPLVLRARPVEIDPAGAYVRLHYSRGLVWDEITKERPKPPEVGVAGAEWEPPARAEAADVLALLVDEPAEPDRIIEAGPTFNHVWIRKGVWSPPAPVTDFNGFTTFRVAVMPRATGGRRSGQAPVPLNAVTIEFEIRDGDRVLKTFRETAGPSGRLCIRVARDRLGPPPDFGPVNSDFLAETMGLREFVTQRADRLAALPWANGPVPRRYGFMTACSGWEGSASDPEIYLQEYRALRQLGVNGLVYDTWPGFDELVRTGPDDMRAFRRVRSYNQNQILRYPGGAMYVIPDFDHNDPARSLAEGWGCPSHPAHAGLKAMMETAVSNMVRELSQTPYEEYWGRTVDEIGSYFDRSAERKAHQGTCPHCREAFRAFLKGFGLTPHDFGVESWEPIRSTFGYWDVPWQDRPTTGEFTPPAVFDDDEEVLVADAADDVAGELIADVKREEAAARAGGEARRAPMPDYGWALLTYYSRRFNNEASARIFTPMRDAMNAQNERKRLALAEGRPDSPEARQPWLYTQALRGNTFLMGGHSLDFFDWYRHADNAFMYETSNRDPRVWPWDSYLCEVGRIHQEKRGTRFGLMIKPGRGAIVQRTLAAVARGVRTVYWYTYGPDWHHPDTFARAPQRLDQISRVVRLVGEAEDALYDAVWAFPAEVAVVRPFTSEVFDNHAAWENGKWIYTLLQHAHIPVDALDEGYLMSEDLGRYKAIVISGSHIRRDVAAKLAEWVRGGGVLVTSGGGLARDESDRPLDELRGVLGLHARDRMALWSEVRRYRSTALADFQPIHPPPAKAMVVPGVMADMGFALAVGREVLDPAPGAEVLARYADGGAAITRHAHGKGAAVTIGYYAGLEYASDLLRPDFDMSVHFQVAKRQATTAAIRAAGVRPVVETSHPLVEGVLLRHPESGRETIVLVNWAFRGRETVPQDNVTVSWRGRGPAKTVKSTWWQARIPAASRDGLFRVVLPRVEDGDILLLE